MADVFISYKRSPVRRLLVRRLALILRAHEVSVWWDFGLESGRRFALEIEQEIQKARVVTPLWCSESVRSKWVLREASLGYRKLCPLLLQEVTPLSPYHEIHAGDLTRWDGDVHHPSIRSYIANVRGKLGRTGNSPVDALEELSLLPKLTPIPMHHPEASRVLQQLRRAYLDQDPGIELEDAVALTMESPIENLVGPLSDDQDVIAALYDLCSSGGNEHLVWNSSDEPLLYQEDGDSISTVGDLVWLIVERTTEPGDQESS